MRGSEGCDDERVSTFFISFGGEADISLCKECACMHVCNQPQSMLSRSEIITTIIIRIYLVMSFAAGYFISISLDVHPSPLLPGGDVQHGFGNKKRGGF